MRQSASAAERKRYVDKLVRSYDDLLRFLEGRPPKRSIFVSYHHGGDRLYYEAFSRLLADTYDVLEDNSLERLVGSDNSEYVIRTIRENYITGSSCTVVLCGAQSPQRKFVDWEIKASLDRQHGLIGVNLPTNPIQIGGTVDVPARLLDNIHSGYAVWTNWVNLVGDPSGFGGLIEQANARSKALIRNDRELRVRNGC